MINEQRKLTVIEKAKVASKIKNEFQHAEKEGGRPFRNEGHMDKNYYHNNHTAKAMAIEVAHAENEGRPFRKNHVGDKDVNDYVFNVHPEIDNTDNDYCIDDLLNDDMCGVPEFEKINERGFRIL